MANDELTRHPLSTASSRHGTSLTRQPRSPRRFRRFITIQITPLCRSRSFSSDRSNVDRVRCHVTSGTVTVPEQCWRRRGAVGIGVVSNRTKSKRVTLSLANRKMTKQHFPRLCPLALMPRVGRRAAPRRAVPSRLLSVLRLSTIGETRVDLDELPLRNYSCLIDDIASFCAAQTRCRFLDRRAVMPACVFGREAWITGKRKVPGELTFKSVLMMI